MRSSPISAYLLLKDFSPLDSGIYFLMFIGMNGHGFITSLCHSLVTLLSNFLKQVGSQLTVLEEEDLKTLD